MSDAPCQLPEVLGQDGIVATLFSASDRGQLGQAYIFHGPSGVGKRLTALALAHHSNLNENRSADKLWQRISNREHPDVRVLEPRDEGMGNIQVEVIRQEVRPWLEFAPFEAKHAWLIFPDADISLSKDHAETSNALLKLIEEPRSGVHFVFCVESLEKLLPTVRSRCQIVRFDRLRDEVVKSILTRHTLEDPPQLETSIALANGRADVALKLLQYPHTEKLFTLAMRFVQQDVEWHNHVTKSSTLADDIVQNVERLCQLSDLKSENRWLLLQVLNLCATAYRDLAATDLACDPRTLRLPSSLMNGLSTRYNARLCADRVAEIEKAKTLLQTTAQPQLILENLVFA